MSSLFVSYSFPPKIPKRNPTVVPRYAAHANSWHDLALGFGRCCLLEVTGVPDGTKAVPEALLEALMACAVPWLRPGGFHQWGYSHSWLISLMDLVFFWWFGGSDVPRLGHRFRKTSNKNRWESDGKWWFEPRKIGIDVGFRADLWLLLALENTDQNGKATWGDWSPKFTSCMGRSSKHSVELAFIWLMSEAYPMTDPYVW